MEGYRNRMGKSRRGCRLSMDAKGKSEVRPRLRLKRFLIPPGPIDGAAEVKFGGGREKRETAGGA